MASETDNQPAVNGDAAATPASVPRTKIAVYCGASSGHRPEHLQMARDLARAMHRHNIALVYGGGTVGIMGELAKTLVSLSGPSAVHGIIPAALIKYERGLTTTPQTTTTSPPSPSLTSSTNPSEQPYGRTTIVPDMHTRKHMMATEVISGGPGSGFIALSGGFGTVEEMFETATWNQLGIHRRGICMLNVGGFFDGILQWIRKSADEGFISETNSGIIVTATDAEGAIEALREYRVSEGVMKLEWDSQ